MVDKAFQDEALRGEKVYSPHGNGAADLNFSYIDFSSAGLFDGGQWDVKGLIPQGAFGLVFGPPGCGKSFWTMDLFHHVAAGRWWNGLRTLQTPCVYIAAEGGRFTQNRLFALRLNKRTLPAGAHFQLLPKAINLRDAKEVARLLDDLQRFRDDWQAERINVAVDTLSRTFGGGKENEADHMAQFVDSCALIQERVGATVVAVHHTGKDEKKGARGHSSLPGALDFEIEIKEDGCDKLARLTKQRDGPAGTAFSFRLNQVDLGDDPDGDKITSCIVEHLGAAAGMSPHEKRELAESLFRDGASARAVIQRCGVSKATAQRWKKDYEQTGMGF